MKLYNPTDNKITVTFKGVTESVEPKGFVTVSEDFGNYWKGTLHNFLEEVASTPVVEATEPEEIPVVEETPVVEEVVYEDLTRIELDKIATEKGIDSKMFQNKAKLIEAIKNI